MKHSAFTYKVLCLLAAMLLFVGKASAQRTYLVSVGLTNYDDGNNPLPCSVNDARAIASFFKNYNNSQVFMLADKNATRDHILRVLKNMFAKATEKDQIIFAYSGHGFEGGISCYNTKDVIYCSEIQNIMHSSKARRKVMFIMSCHSGSFKKKYGNVSPRQDYKSKKSSVMLCLSSRANEYSWEDAEMKNSFFFNRLIRGLKGVADDNKDGLVTARELFNYIYAGVIVDTQGAQHPQMFGNFPDDMVVVKTR